MEKGYQDTSNFRAFDMFVQTSTKTVEDLTHTLEDIDIPVIYFQGQTFQ